MPTSEDFGAGGGDLFPGTIRLGRLFGVDRKGLLHSPFKDPGMAFYPDRSVDNDYRLEIFYWARKNNRVEKSGRMDSPDGWHESRCFKDCDTGKPKRYCQCGFYTFFRRPQRYMWSPQPYFVDAIVEGKGRVVVGELGARLGQMRILALVVNPEEGTLRMLGRTFKEFLGRLIRFKLAALSSLLWVSWLCFWMFYTLFISSTDGWVKVLTVIAYAMIMVLFGMTLMLNGVMRHYTALPRDVYKSLQEQYPDIEFFTTWKEAAKKYPLSDAKDFQKED